MSYKGQNTKHGHCQWNGPSSPTYNSWRGMIERCTYQKHNAYHNYGGRGITVSDEWRVFANFLRDMGERPCGHSLERRDTNGNYSADNCYWATNKDQSRNTRRTRLVTHQGRTQCLKDWAKEAGINYGTLISRLNKFGWTFEEALSPSQGRGANHLTYDPD